MPDALERARDAVRRGDPDARARLEEALAAVRGDPTRRLEWARLSEEGGAADLVCREFERILAETPDDVPTLEKLRTIHEERGDTRRAVDLARRLWTLRPTAENARALVSLLVAVGEMAEAQDIHRAAIARGLKLDPWDEIDAPAAGPDDIGPVPGDEPGTAELDRLEADAIRFHQLFAGRENVYARQWVNDHGEGGYSPVREPLTPREIRRHLSGSVTIGIYPVRLDGTVLLMAVDIDVTRRAIEQARGNRDESRRLKRLAHEEAVRLRGVLAGLGLPALLEDSGYKGRHLWVLLAEPVPATEAREFGERLLAAHPPASTEIAFEFFPKQGSAGRGIGNLIKLPLGIHRRTGRRSQFLRDDGTVDPDPHGTLRGWPRVDPDAFLAALARVRAEAPRVSGAAPATGSAPGEREGTSDQASVAPTVAAPAPPAPPPAWTGADFDTHPEIAHLFRRCHVLGELRRRAEQHRQLTHDEQVVLRNAVGHSPAGVLAVNYLFERCPDVPREARLQSPFRGNPISCARIRQRVPHVVASVPCDCQFPEAAQYPNPRRHLETLPPEALAGGQAAAPAWDPVERARTLGVLWRRREELEREIAIAERELVAWLERQPPGELDLGDGVLRLVRDDGPVAFLRWEPAPQAGAGVASASPDEGAVADARPREKASAPMTAASPEAGVTPPGAPRAST